MAYIDGNAVRKRNDLPDAAQNALPKQTKKVSRQVRKNRNQALHMNGGYVVFLAVAAVTALIVCTRYLQLQSEITNRSRNISALQQELENLKEDNTTRYNAVLNSANLQEVREKAMNELGMVYSTPEQIVKYKSPTGNEVKQYETIPKSGILAEADKVKK